MTPLGKETLVVNIYLSKAELTKYKYGCKKKDEVKY